jgi:hypothetical protein
MTTNLSDFERAVLDKLLDGDLPELSVLRHQLSQCVVKSREQTGVGFYTELMIPEDAPSLNGVSAVFGDVAADIVGLQNGAGFLLYLKDGRIKMLEGYSYDEPWPLLIQSFVLKYSVGECRDMRVLAANLAPSLH